MISLVNAPVVSPCVSTMDGLMSGPFKGHNGTVRVVKFQPTAELSGATVAAAEEEDAPILFASAGAGDCRPRLFDVFTGERTYVNDRRT
jgi:hypothetical protein